MESFKANAVGSLALLMVLAVPDASKADSPEGSAFELQVRPLLKTYCFECHGEGLKEGNLALDLAPASGGDLKQRDLWWKVLKNLRSGVMPPVGHARPTTQEQETIATGIKFGVFGIDPENPDPGRIGVRRLNRSEYDNTVDDLMGIKFDASLVFPPDDSGYGFDNVGDALSFSPLLMEKYLRAAQTIVDQSVPKVTWIVPRQDFVGRDFVGDNDRINGGRISGKKVATVRQTV